MLVKRRNGPHKVASPRQRVLRRGLVLVAGMALAGCGALNPSFVNLLDPDGSQGFQTVNNAPGHLVVSVINNAEIDERLLDYLETLTTFSEAEERALRPRVRMRLRVTFVDGSFQTIEFITGSPNLIDPAFSAQAFPDLNQNDLSNAVVLCDVASVQMEPGTTVEVFVPVELTGFELVEISGEGGQVTLEFQPRQRTPPQFLALQTDDVDEDGNVVLQRNIGARDVPGAVIGLSCGSVVAIVINGVLSVPFLTGVSDAPSFDIGDDATVATIGGRYEFVATVQ
jgi:hypothetical protein